MLVQILSFKSERDQHLMMFFVFLIFIVYSCYSVLRVPLLFVVPAIIVFGLVIIHFFRNQFQNKLKIQPQVIFKGNKHSQLIKSRKWFFISSLIYSSLTILHFAIVYLGNESIVPLLYDYGFGGLLALGLNFYMAKNWSYGICDEGIIIGSKLDNKVVCWSEIGSINYDNQQIVIIFKNYFPFSELKISDFQSVEVFKKLLTYKI